MKEIETSKIYTVFKLLTFLQLNNTSQLIFIHLTLCSKLTLEQFKVSQLCLVNTEKRESWHICLLILDTGHFDFGSYRTKEKSQ